MTVAAAHVFAAPDGIKGFDADTVVTADDAKKFFEAGYRFAVRYVPRTTRNPQDLTAKEVDDILRSGLGLMVVQHVSPGSATPKGWVPSGTLGGKYGTVAAQEAIACGIPAGVSVWCDLEGVAPHIAAQPVIDFCIRWLRSVASSGFLPGLYVGWHPGLTAAELYSLPFTHYWGAYNVDVVPSVRGFQMKQSSITRARVLANGETEDDRVPGVNWFTTDSSDVNHVMADKLGGRAQLLQVPPVLPIGG